MITETLEPNSNLYQNLKLEKRLESYYKTKMNTWICRLANYD
jgi:hypothetical protein